jgi:integrase
MQLPNSLLTQVRQLPAVLQCKYERLGLVGVQSGPKSLGDLTTAFLNQRSIAPGTRVIYERTVGRLHKFFGEGLDIATLKPEDAHRWKAWLFSPEATDRKEPMGVGTVSKHVSQGKTIFQWAVDLEWLDRTPFRGVTNGSQVNARRVAFVSEETIEMVLAQSTDPQLRALIGLGRYGGLRMPSEAAELTWQQVDLPNSTLSVFSPKTKRTRKLPICSRLRDLLMELQTVSNGCNPRLFPALQRDTNLRTPLLRLIRRAKVPVWPRLWHNLRGSRVNSWLDRGYDISHVAEWMGHCPHILLKHYRQARGDAFARATKD